MDSDQHGMKSNMRRTAVGVLRHEVTTQLQTQGVPARVGARVTLYPDPNPNRNSNPTHPPPAAPKWAP